MAGDIGLNKPMKSLPSVTSKHIQEPNLPAPPPKFNLHTIFPIRYTVLESHVSIDPMPTGPDWEKEQTILQEAVFTQLTLGPTDKTFSTALTHGG